MCNVKYWKMLQIQSCPEAQIKVQKMQVTEVNIVKKTYISWNYCFSKKINVESF